MTSVPLAAPFWSPEDVDASLRATIAHLNAGRVLGYPTETVYGFGTAVDQESVETLVRMKRRPPTKPFLLLVASTQMIERLALQLTPAAAAFAARHWPGPLTLVLPGGDRRVPARLRGPEGGVGVRWTSHAGLQRLILAYGEPITSTSANRPGQPAAESSGEIVAQWGDEIGRGLLRVLDGGRLVPSEPSTVVDCTGRTPRVIRPGALHASVLRASVADLIGDA
jgi:L-threonylcarbamoyladenylate synthase